MSEVWDEARIQQYIDDKIEENLNLDYKAADALDKKKTDDITKAVSAMANSDGGIIIYGIDEGQTNRHYPSKIDPIDRRKFSKEQLEHIINNIRPKIDGLVIYPVSIQPDPNKPDSKPVVYVVDIPKGRTAHQATDRKYYRRYNFESVPML